MSPWILIIITLLLSAFFSGMEIAFISANKLKLELDKKKGNVPAKLLSYYASIPTKFIGALLVGNNAALVIYGIGMAKVINPYLENTLPQALGTDSIILLLETIVTSLVILFFAEFLPKVIFRINANKILHATAIPITSFYYLFYPLIQVYIGISQFLLRTVFRINITKQKIKFNFIDFENYLKEYAPPQNEDSEIQQELQMFQNVIDFRQVKLRECMVPRTEVVAVNINDNVSSLRDAFVNHGLSRVMIYRDTLDNITGYCHSSDMFKKPQSIHEVVRQVTYVPETMHANDVLSLFIEKNQNIATVVDEFGGTAGLVTMEDIIEEIFGEIEDEYDEELMEEERLSDYEYILSSRLEIDYLNEKYNLDLPESDEYETISGLLIHYQENIPSIGQKVEIGKFTFIILNASRKRVEKVRLLISKEE
ncbi:MAG: hemolysin family protein [Bacteroidales bacterium]|nr:hemolysin family protein [Bacteroidales bacterium]MCF8333508.1 hemolysin family protein [Bacteroidales bacterium]